MLLVLFILKLCAAQAQGYLAKPLAVEGVKGVPLNEVLGITAKQLGFHYSYSNDHVPADSLVSFPTFQGPLHVFLENLLGDRYEFKEMPGYVIIRYVPRRLVPTIMVEASNQQSLLIQGHVRDASTLEAIANASIYDKHSFASALSDGNGYFELRVRRPDQTVWMAISKANYRDTTMMVLLPIEVSYEQKKTMFNYYGQESPVLNTWLGNLITTSRQRIQQLNIGALFAEKSYQLSLWPGLGTRGKANDRTINQVSMNVLGGYGAGVSGFEVSGIFSINQQDVSRFQAAGLFNLVGASVTGLQFAGGGNRVFGQVSGFQVAGFYNAVAGQVSGMQVAGVFNRANKVKGVQLAGILNIADSSDYPIGLINLVKSGSKSLSLEVDELQRASINFRSGGRMLYGLVGLGYAMDNQNLRYGLNAGFGAHVVNGSLLGLDGELLSKTYTDFSRVQSQFSLALLAQLKLSKHLALYAGPSINLTTSFDAPLVDSPRWILYDHEEQDGEATVLHGGVSAGLRYTW